MATTGTQERTAPTISQALIDDIAKRGRAIVQAEFGMRDDAFCAMVKTHAFAIYCHEHPAFAQSVNYKPKFVGDYEPGEWD